MQSVDEASVRRADDGELAAPVGVGTAGSTSFLKAVTASFDASQGGGASLDQYLSDGGGAGPEEAASRAKSLIRELGRRGGSLDFEALNSAVNRVVEKSIQLLANGPILRLGVEGGYRPVRPVLSLDFGPAGPETPGFERVTPKDPRLGGRNLTVERGGNALGSLASGILGIERIELDLPDDTYRVILLTRRGGPGGKAPFGSEVFVNGARFAITPEASQRWTQAALLTRHSTKVASNAAAAGAKIEEFAFTKRLRGAQDQGGVLVVEGRASGGKLTVKLTPAGSLPTFLTSVLIERMQGPSDLVLGGEGARSVVSLSRRLDLQEQIFAVAAQVLGEAAPEIGRPALADVPAPLLAADEVESPS